MELGDNPIVGRTDPATSAEAADRVTRSGARKANAERVLALVVATPGLTAVELWHAQKDAAGAMGRHEVSRRAADLMRKGRVRQGPPRACSVAGTNQVTWWPAGPRPPATGLFDGV
jgi:hypothetical protein